MPPNERNMTASKNPSRSMPRLLGATVVVATQVLAPVANALQVIEAIDGVTVEAILSRREPTRIRIEGASITDVFGQIHSSHCGANATAAPLSGLSPPTVPGQMPLLAPQPPAVNPAGDVVVECDRDKGEIYVRPVGDSPRPVNLFVSSALATYTLLLRRADTPADTIVIRDRSAAAAQATVPGRLPAGPAPSHLRALKALLVAAASDRPSADIRVQDTSREVRLWAEARFTLQRVYEGRGFVAEKYRLQNTSASAMVLAEPEFDRSDSPSRGEVAGVAIERHVLQPGEATNVYVLRRGGTP